MYPSVFWKLCNIIREKALLQDTKFICVQEMLALFLLIVGQDSRYWVVHKTFGKSHFATSQSFNKILKVLNTIAINIMTKSGSTVPEKIRESTRFYPYFKVSDEIIYFYFKVIDEIIIILIFLSLFQDCIGAIDGTHILAMITGRDKSSYRNRHGTILQNV